MHESRVPMGTTFQKKFGGCGTFLGTLTAFDSKENLYQVTYQDDDVEELTWTELSKFLKQSGDIVTAPLAAERLVIEEPEIIPDVLLPGTLLHRELDGGLHEVGVVGQFNGGLSGYDVRWDKRYLSSHSHEDLVRLILRKKLSGVSGTSRADSPAEKQSGDVLARMLEATSKQGPFEQLSPVAATPVPRLDVAAEGNETVAHESSTNPPPPPSTADPEPFIEESPQSKPVHRVRPRRIVSTPTVASDTESAGDLNVATDEGSDDEFILEKPARKTKKRTVPKVLTC